MSVYGKKNFKIQDMYFCGPQKLSMPKELVSLCFYNFRYMCMPYGKKFKLI